MNFDLVCLNFPQDFAHSLTVSLCFNNSYFKSLLLHKFKQDSLLVDCDSNCLRMSSFVDYCYEIYCSNIHDTINS